MVFACFMVASMIGAALAGRLMESGRCKVERYMQVVFVAASLCLSVPVMVPPVKAGTTYDEINWKCRVCHEINLLVIALTDPSTFISIAVPHPIRNCAAEMGCHMRDSCTYLPFVDLRSALGCSGPP